MNTFLAIVVASVGDHAMLKFPRMEVMDQDLKDLAESLIKHHEGYCDHVYNDSLGVPTLGWGRNVSKSGGLRVSEAQFMLDNDLDDRYKFMDSTYPWFKGLNSARRAALLDMCFQLGCSGFSLFERSIFHLSLGNFTDAADTMLKSKWANQTPRRAKAITDIIRTGVINND